MNNILKTIFSLLLALALIISKGIVLCMLLVEINNLFIVLFDIILFTKVLHFNLDSYIYSITIIIFVDALYYNYTKIKI